MLKNDEKVWKKLLKIILAEDSQKIKKNEARTTLSCNDLKMRKNENIFMQIIFIKKESGMSWIRGETILTNVNELTYTKEVCEVKKEQKKQLISD